jgi:hypothetical protein
VVHGDLWFFACPPARAGGERGLAKKRLPLPFSDGTGSRDSSSSVLPLPGCVGGVLATAAAATG